MDKITNGLKKRFCRDVKASIYVMDEPYFSDRVKLLGYEDAYNKFINEISEFRTEEDYFAYYNEIKEKIITYLVDGGIRTYLENYTQKYSNNNFPKTNIYTRLNNDKRFISIDVRKACYTTLYKNFPALFGYNNSGTWEEFVSKFTAFSHIINSKYIREVIFGTLNPKRQQVIIKDEVAEFLFNFQKDYTKQNNINLISVDSDEIIFEYLGDDIYTEVANIKEYINNLGLAYEFKVEGFALYSINVDGGELGYRKVIFEDEDNYDIEYKCVEGDILNQVFCHYTNKPITDNDLVFLYNGRLAKYLTPIQIEENEADKW